jgi:hypothetical protein
VIRLSLERRGEVFTEVETLVAITSDKKRFNAGKE